MKKFTKFFLFLILVLGFIVRFYRLNFPLADWHSWRQADTASVTRRYLQEGIDLLHPRYDDLSSIPSGKSNPQGWRFVEFPLYNLLHVFLTKSFGFLSLEAWGRVLSNLFSLGSLLLLFFLVKELVDEKTALLSSFFFAFLPFNIFYSRTILPEPMMVCFSLAFMYFFILLIKKIKEKKNQWFFLILFLVFLSLSLLIKPYVLFLSFPLAYHGIKNLGKKFFRFDLIILILLSFLPFILWRWWEAHFPEGVPSYSWLFNSTAIRFRPAFFRWLFAERIARLILGFWGTIFLVLGIVKKTEKKEGSFCHWWLFGILLYFIVFATGNVTHDYYQVIAIPLVSIFLAKGSLFFLRLPKNLVFVFLSRLLFFILIFFMFSFSWFYIRDFFNINHPEIVEAGEVVDKITAQDALVIAPYGGDTAFLYQTKRRGWPVGGEIEEKIKEGADFFVSVNFDEETKGLIEKCRALVKTEKFVIIALKECF